MSDPSVITLDLHFQDTPSVIAAYLIPHREGAALIESGPGSTQVHLENQLRQNGLSLSDITDVFLTHIHLDHAGAAGWLAQHGATVHVHPNGAPHLCNPDKLLSSAARIYGEDMDRLWGEFLPVPEERISVLTDSQTVHIHGLSILPLDTPGHANHHMSYLFEGICFSGDIAGVRLDGLPILRIPMPPPEFHLERWRSSLGRISSHSFQVIAPTHFGFYHDPEWHIQGVRNRLDEVEAWMESVLNESIPLSVLRQEYQTWISHLDHNDLLMGEHKKGYELANPTFMSADGILRYWTKYR